MEYLLSRLIGYIAENMPELSLVDEDYGQLANLDKADEDMHPLTFPAVLIEPSEVRWEYLRGEHQKGDATLRIRLIVDCYDDTHEESGTTYRIMERELLRHRLHSLLQGYRPLEDGKLMRTQSSFFTANYGIKVYESTYTCTVTELIEERVVSIDTPPQLVLMTEALGQT